MTENTGPLSDIRVLDLTRILAGPTGTQTLGDLGADVIKIERPNEGDDTRKWGPPFLKDKDGKDMRESSYFLAANRNKRSLSIDITKPEGQALIRELLADCDVLVENFKVGGLEKYDLSYDQLKADFPALIYCSITGFGQTGPYAPRPGYDYLVQGMGGIMSLTGEPEGEPMKVGVGISDVVCGMNAMIAVLAALHDRKKTGLGQWIDMSLLDSQVAWLVNEGMNYLLSGKLPRRLGNAHANIVPYQLFPTSDGHVIIAIGNDSQFRRFCDVAGLGGCADDSRFATNPARLENRGELIALIKGVTQQRTMCDWLNGLEAAGVPCAPVNDLQQVFEDPQVINRAMRITMDNPAAQGGAVDLIGSPIKMSRTPVSYRRAPPRLGEHTDEILSSELKLDANKIRKLREMGVI
ncbi:MAG: CoA transferase [Rhodospirillaceae bacterium]|nr:CoA transferase [Rhodospirillaceae bacterium]